LLPGWPWNKVTEYRDLQGGETISAKMGQSFSISKLQFQTGDNWKASSANSAIVELIGTSYRDPELSFLGTSGLILFTFKALAAGSASIILTLSNPNNILPDAYLTIKVEVS
jgi:predicted secreted protein